MGGPIIRSTTPQGPFVDVLEVRIRTIQDKKTNLTNYQIYTTIGYQGSWRFYEQVNFLGGEQQKLIVINRNVEFCSGSSCHHKETVGFDIAEATLKAASEPGLSFRLNTKMGLKNQVSISSSYIKGYLMAINQP